MKKIIILMVFIIIFAGSVSAATWDNVGTYYPETRTMEIRNSVLGFDWWQLDPVANLTLVTPSHNLVYAGEDVMVAHIKVDIFEEITTPLSKLNFYNYFKRIGKEKSFTYKRFRNENVQVNDTEIQCGNNVNGTYECARVTLDTTHQETIKTWQSFNHVGTIPVGTYHIGIFTDVDEGERTEWIPNYFGVEIDEWADFTGLTKYEFYEGSSDDISFPRTSDNRWIGQPFRVGTTGENTTLIPRGFSINSNGKVGSTVPYTWSIIGVNASNHPNKTDVLCQVEADTANFSAGYNNISIPDCPALEMGGTYALVVNTTTGSDSDNAPWRQDTTSPTYSSTLDGRCVSTDSGNNWTCYSTADFLFNIWGVNSTEVPNVTLNTPANDYNHLDNNLTFNCTSKSLFGALNLTLIIDDIVNTTISNSTANENLTLVAQRNVTIDTHNWTCKSTNNLGQTIASARNFTIGSFTENGQNFSNITLEGFNETFQFNLTLGTGRDISTIDFVYDSIKYNASSTNVSQEFFATKSIIIPGVNVEENKTFYWTSTLDNGVSFNSTFNNQTIEPALFGLCNSTLTNAFINFTFKNETISEEDVNATLVSTWSFSVTGSNVTGTLSFSNATENPSYGFCFSPPDKEILATYNLSYNNDESQQRSFSATSVLTNATTNTVLYLLPTVAGIFSPFRTLDGNGDVVAAVSAVITRTLEGSTITASSGITDSSGFITFFLNPDVTYIGTFTKSGFPNNIFSFVPTNDLRTVTMGGGLTEIANGTQISQNTSYGISPASGTLNNNTDVTFAFSLNSTQTITLISMNISNSSGSQLLFQSNAGTGRISGIANTGNNSQLIGTFLYQTADETWSVTKTWIVAIQYIGEYSIFRQMNLYMEYGFQDFFRFLVIFGVIGIVIIFMSSQEITDTSESKVIVGTLLVWAFSLIGWLNTGLSSNSSLSTINSLAQFSNQYGVAILTTVFAFFFIARRLFIRRI